MTETNINVIILFSVLIGIIAFFARPRFLMIFILIFIYLLPRAGFLISTKWYYFPLPIGYLFVAFIMIRWVFTSISEKAKLKRKSPIDDLFLIYIIIAILAILVGLINGGSIPTMLLEVAFYFAAFFVFFMVLDMFNDKNTIKIFMAGILICAFLVSLYGVLLLIYGKSLLISYITYNSSSFTALLGQFIIARRTISSYGDPNSLSTQLMVFCGIFASMLLLGKNRFQKNIFLLTGLILTIICIYFASSRASLIGLFVLFIILAATKIKKLWFYIPVLTIGYLIFLEPIRIYYEHRIFSAGIPAYDLRIQYIKEFFDLFIRFPFGVGFGNSIDRYYNMIPAYSIWTGFNSFYIHIFSRVGIQGLVVFSLMLIFIIKYLFKEFRHIDDPNTRYFVFGGTCGLIVQQFNFMANNVYHVPGGMLNFWIMCGMLVAIVNLYKKPL